MRCGIIGGIVLPEAIDIAGMVKYHHAVGIMFLPVYLAVIGGAGVRLASLFGRRRDWQARK